MNPLHYCDLERCKKLTEIGFPNTKLCWCGNSNRQGELGEPEMYDMDLSSPRRQNQFIAQCPSVMEMLDVIPKQVKDGDDYALLELYPSLIPTEKKWFACYIDLGTGNKIDSSLDTEAQTLPNALADLIFWLHENNYIKF